VVRNQLVADIAAHEAKLAEAKDKVSEKVIAHDKHGLPVKMKDNAVDSALVDEGEALHDRLTQFVTDLEDAQRECGNKLNATWGGAQFVQADKTDVNNPNVYGTSNDSKRDQTRTGQAPWGFPEVWQRANMGASGKLALGGAWNSFAGSFKDLADLMGVGGDEGATNHKRSALLKLKEYIETYAKNTSWTAPYTRSVSPEEQKRYEEACKALGESLKGMVSYDTWGTDPHGTAGGFLPDALSIATGGGAGKLGLKMLGKLSPKLAMNLTALRQVFRLKNLGNWTHDALELLRTIGKNTPEGMAQRELKQLQEIVDGNIPIADKAVDGSDTPRTAPVKGPGPIESGFNRSGSGAGTHLNDTGVGGSHPGGGSGAGAGGHQLDGSGRGSPSRHGAGSGHWNGGHPQRSGEHGWSVPREGAEHHAPRRGDGGGTRTVPRSGLVILRAEGPVALARMRRRGVRWTARMPAGSTTPLGMGVVTMPVVPEDRGIPRRKFPVTRPRVPSGRMMVPGLLRTAENFTVTMVNRWFTTVAMVACITQVTRRAPTVALRMADGN